MKLQWKEDAKLKKIIEETQGEYNEKMAAFEKADPDRFKEDPQFWGYAKRASRSIGKPRGITGNPLWTMTETHEAEYRKMKDTEEEAAHQAKVTKEEGEFQATKAKEQKEYDTEQMNMWDTYYSKKRRRYQPWGSSGILG